MSKRSNKALRQRRTRAGSKTHTPSRRKGGSKAGSN